MHPYRHLALLFSLIILADFASARTLKFDQKYWEKILHYQNGKSKADGKKFFLATDGKTNPENELIATLKAFNDGDARAGWFNYHPQCVFRERYLFLKTQGLLPGVVEKNCPEFDEWKQGLNAESVSLIFSSSYPNNPSSLFGHTLLRLNQKAANGKKQDLLDYVVAFSAVPEKEDLGLVFALKGMFGGYKGLFEITKYYAKVNEYSNGESRDLIEYNLSMSEEELERMINHLWELYQTTYFDYYFTDENCSAVLADLLSVAYKDDERINEHARWYYLPGEMIKHFSKLEGRVSSVTYRPSLKKQVAREWEKLSREEVGELKGIIESKILPQNVDNIKVLDAIASTLDFTQNRTKNKLDAEVALLQRNALLKRSTLSKAELTIGSFDQKNRPEFSHNPQKVSFFNRFEEGDFQMGIELKQGFHDLMSRDLGYDSFSQFDFLSASALYDFKRKKLKLHELMLVDLASLHEFRYYDPQPTWRTKVNYERIHDLPCKSCYKFNVLVLGGLGYRPDEQSIINLMFGASAEVSKYFIKGYRLGPEIELSFYRLFWDTFKIGLSEEFKLDATKKMNRDYYHQATLRTSYFLSENIDLRVEGKLVSSFGSMSLDTSIFEVKYGIFF